MKIHYLQRVQMLPIEQDIAWAFFSNPANLSQLVPPWMGMVNESFEQPKVIYPGLLQVYRFKMLGLLPARWVAEITHVDGPRSFTDEQKIGPFAFWQHRHELQPVEDGVEVIDKVHYAMPVGTFGTAAHQLFARKQLEAMFDYRAQILREFFSE